MAAKKARKTPSAEVTESNQVPALARGLAVLELLAGHPEGMNLVDIAAALRLPVNSTQRIGLTLCALGYAQRDAISKRFFLTSKLLSVGGRGLGEHSLMERALDVMRELRDAVRETVLLGVLNGDEIVCLEQVLSLHAFKFMVDPGLRAPLHSCAPGKAIWAYLPDAQREAMLARVQLTRLTPHTITTPAAMADELRQTRALGYAVDRAEGIEGCHCVAAPVLDHRNYPLAAIWVSGPANRLAESMFPAVGKLTVEHAARISQRLGHVVLTPG
jgi:DNA-binding IclR family transcriptional regulator